MNHIIFVDAQGAVWAFPPYALSHIIPAYEDRFCGGQPIADKCVLVFNTGFTAAGASQERIVMGKSAQAVLDDIKAWYAAQPKPTPLDATDPAVAG